MTRCPDTTLSAIRTRTMAVHHQPRRLRSVAIGLCALAWSGWCGGDAAAQMFSYHPDRPRAVQSVALGRTVVDFRFRGDGVPDPSFEFAGPLYGAVYTRPNFHVAFGYGREDERDLRMLDASLTTWGEFRIAGSDVSRLYVPIALHSDYRRVARAGQEDSLVDAFNVTVIGLGTGLGFVTRSFAGMAIEGRATPIIGLALRAFGDSAGSSHLIDTHLQLHSPPIVGRLGFTAGYGYRSQRWNVRSSTLFPVTQDDLYDYTGSSHMLSIGVNW